MKKVSTLLNGKADSDHTHSGLAKCGTVTIAGNGNTTLNCQNMILAGDRNNSMSPQSAWKVGASAFVMASNNGSYLTVSNVTATSIRVNSSNSGQMKCYYYFF